MSSKWSVFEPITQENMSRIKIKRDKEFSLNLTHTVNAWNMRKKTYLVVLFDLWQQESMTKHLDFFA